MPGWGGGGKGCSWLQPLSWEVTLVAGWGFLLESAERLQDLAGGQGLSSALSCLLSWAIGGEMVVLLLVDFCCGENLLPLWSFVLHCFSLLWVSLCSQELPLNWDLFYTLSHWEGPSPSAQVLQGKPSTLMCSLSLEGAFPGCLQEPSSCCHPQNITWER